MKRRRFRDWWFETPPAPPPPPPAPPVPTLYNPRNVTFKVTPSIHVDAIVTIVLENGKELPEMRDYVFSYEPSEIARYGRDLIERYNRMMDLSETIR